MLNHNYLFRWIKAILLYVILTCEPVIATEQVHNVIACHIVSMEQKILKKFPGALCAFLDDGRVISGGQDKLIMYSAQGKELWSKDLNVHHQLNLSIDRTKILLLSSEARQIKKKLIRFDVFLVFDLNGNQIGRFSVFEHKKYFDSLVPKSRRGRVFNFGGTVLGTIADEYTHANSIYEIPENPTGAKHTAFKRGNILVNLAYNGVFLILDSKLKTILWSSSYEKFGTNQAHDAQILPNGNLLFYSNGDAGSSESFASLVEANPVSKTIVWRYVGSPRKSFIAPHSGGIQYLDNGNVLFSTVDSGGQAFEIDKSGSVRWQYANTAEADGMAFRIQQIKRYNLFKFLKNNSSL